MDGSRDECGLTGILSVPESAESGAHSGSQPAKNSYSVDGWALDPFNGVYRQDFLLPMQFEAEFAQDCEDCGQAREVHAPIAVLWRRGQPHGYPAFRMYGEQSAKIGAVHDRQVGPVLM